MAITFAPAYRSLAVGGVAAAALIGAFTLGSSKGSAAPSPSSSRGPAGATSAVLTSANAGARITVTGTGNVTGIPNQLVLDMGVQVNGSSVSSALASANAAVNRVTAALRADGVAAADAALAKGNKSGHHGRGAGTK